MRSKFLLCLALVLIGGMFNGTSAVAGATFVSTRYGFRFDLPDGWMVRETYFSFAHYSDVILTINNQRPDLEIHDWPTGNNAMGFGPQTTSEQMQAGEVYISIGFSSGPGGDTLRRETVGRDLAPLLATNTISPSSQPGLSGLNLRFFKRGHWWFVSANLKDPATEENRRAVMAMLQSFCFVDGPVANNAWAESLAWEHLPPQIQMPGHELWAGWPTVDGTGTEPSTSMAGERKAVIQRTGAGYAVQFRLLGLATWNYVVSTNGSVQAKPTVFDAISEPASRLPSDLPGENKGKIDAAWVAPYVQSINEFGKRTLIWFSKDGSIERHEAMNDLHPGFAGISGPPYRIQGINENWQITLPPAHDPGLAGYITSTADSRVFVHERRPKLGLVALDVYIHGKQVNTLGPSPQYAGNDVVLNEDGSAALLVTEKNMAIHPSNDEVALHGVLTEAQEVHAQVIVLNSNGAFQFKTDCGPAVWSPMAAPNGAGVLLRSNGGTNQNDFIWFTAAGRQHSLQINPNPECLGWIPQTCLSLFSTSIGYQSGPYELIDWKTGKPHWKIPSPGTGETLAIGFTPEFILFSVAETSPSTEARDVNSPLVRRGKKWVRTFYAVNVRDGTTAARWQGQFPHRGFDAERDSFLQLNGRLYYLTADEFTEISLEDIRMKRNGWQ